MRTTARVLIVDDAVEVRQLLRRLVEKAGMEVLQATDGRTALSIIQEQSPDLVLLDIRIPGLDGREVLQQARAIDPSLPIIMMTAFGSIPDAVQLVKAGAQDYLTKPFTNAQVIQTVRRALEEQPARTRPAPDDVPLEPQGALTRLMGLSRKIEALDAEVGRVAPTDFSVLIVGETGVGKELVAESIHSRSRRREAEFVGVDCGAIPESLIESELFGYEKGAFTGADRTRPGRFEAAEGGTLFLDEISNLSPSMQNKLLRVLQERRFYRVGGTTPIRSDVRILAASNQNLNSASGPSAFRTDLYHRLSEYIIYVPPLRERKGDIAFLADRFIKLTNAEFEKDVRGISRVALEALVAYDWVGNVRELRNVIRRGVLWANETIDLEHLGAIQPPLACVLPSEQKDLSPVDEAMAGRLSLKEIVRRARMAVEQKVIVQLMEQTGGNIAEVARILGADYKTIHTKIKEYGIQTRTSITAGSFIAARTEGQVAP
jgi:two-component system nitrogen regulation response regulator GlnG